MADFEFRNGRLCEAGDQDTTNAQWTRDDCEEQCESDERECGVESTDD